jgi:hypothetical protein
MKEKIKVGKKMTRLILDEAMNIIEDYLNAGDKQTRKAAHEKAKIIYAQYYGIEYKNRNEIGACKEEYSVFGSVWKLEQIQQNVDAKNMTDRVHNKLSFRNIKSGNTRTLSLTDKTINENAEYFTDLHLKLWTGSELEFLENY